LSAGSGRFRCSFLSIGPRERASAPGGRRIQAPRYSAVASRANTPATPCGPAEEEPR
jgi:hypothetical protein